MSFEVSLWTSKDVQSFEVCLDPSRSFEWLSGRQIILRSECLSFVHGNLFWVYISMKGFTFTPSSDSLSKVCVLVESFCVCEPRSCKSVFSVWSRSVTVSTEIQEKTLILACLLFLLFTLLSYKLRFAC